MRSRAKVEIKGRIASDLAEATVNDKKVVNFRVAVDRRPKKDSTEKPETDFFSVSVWGMLSGRFRWRAAPSGPRVLVQPA